MLYLQIPHIYTSPKILLIHFTKGPVCPIKLHQQKKASNHYTKTATRAPTPPATRAAACVGIVAAKFELVDLLDEPVLTPPYGFVVDVVVVGWEVVGEPYPLDEVLLTEPEVEEEGGPYPLDEELLTEPVVEEVGGPYPMDEELLTVPEVEEVGGP